MRVITATLAALVAVFGGLGIVIFFKAAYVAAENIDLLCATPAIAFGIALGAAGAFLLALWFSLTRRL